MIDQYPVDLVDNSYPLLTGSGLRIARREMLPEIFDCHFLVAAIGEVTVRRRTRIPARYLVSRQQPGAQPERGTKAFNVLKAALSQRRSRGDVMHARLLQSAKVTGKQGNEMVVSVIICLHRLAGIQRRPSDDVGITIRGPSRAAGCFQHGGKCLGHRRFWGQIASQALAQYVTQAAQLGICAASHVRAEIFHTSQQQIPSRELARPVH